MFAVIVAAVLMSGCGSGKQAKDAPDHDDGWAVTAWGERYEIFAESSPLIAGQVSKSHTHVTVLADFSALGAGVVSAVLTGGGGAESVFRQDKAVRDGIFSVEIKPQEEGEFDLSFRVESAAGPEEIPAGRVRVGNAQAPGGVLTSEADGAGASTTPVSFLKEQQWRTEFRTEWVNEGSIRASIHGPGKVRAAAGSEAVLSAPLDGVVTTGTRLHVGLAAERGATVAELSPRAESHWTLAELEAEANLARSRLSRLENLLAVEAVSAAEVEAARTKVTALDAQLDATRGSRGLKPVAIRAPFSGEVAEVSIVPGQAVSAGDPLLRLVRRSPVWIEVALLPRSAVLVEKTSAGLVLTAAGFEPVSLRDTDVKVVSQSPEVERTTGTVTTIFEANEQLPVPLGTAVDVEVLLSEERRGIVIPASAIVDDGGVSVVYVQDEGEAFTRQEVAVGATQGDRALVQGLSPGARIVTRGGGAIRRAALMTTGEIEGHVH
jgi:RND family efflux transporter MFP subunit